VFDTACGSAAHDRGCSRTAALPKKRSRCELVCHFVVVVSFVEGARPAMEGEDGRVSLSLDGMEVDDPDPLMEGDALMEGAVAGEGEGEGEGQGGAGLGPVGVVEGLPADVPMPVGVDGMPVAEGQGRLPPEVLWKAANYAWDFRDLLLDGQPYPNNVLFMYVVVQMLAVMCV
jgi:hypothetical protein